MPAACACSWDMGPGLEEHNMPVPPVLPLLAPSEHIMNPDFTSEPIFSSSSPVFCFLPIVHRESACPPTPHPPARLPMLLTQSLLCLLAHKYLQFKATMVPSTNRKEDSWESSGSLPCGSGLYSPCRVKHARLRVIWSGRNWNGVARKRSPK